MLAKHLLVTAAFSIVTSAEALDVDGVNVDDKVSVGGRELVLNGAGIRKRAIFKVYVGSLFLPEKARTTQEALAKAPRRIQLNLLRTLSADQLVGALVEGLQKNLTDAELQSIRVQTGELAAIMKSFGAAKEGSIVTLDFVDNATRIGLDGAPRGAIDGAEFNAALTRIWIGEQPVQADLKKAMLGGA